MTRRKVEGKGRVEVEVELALGQGIDDADGTMLLMVALVLSKLEAACCRRWSEVNNKAQTEFADCFD
ncbi:hypothetical protein ANO14919_051170 [Xylariales sp. No.14919]|nr:hypothetical protein ANO14919_051170 [Xylariales sp. No.14919]